MTDKKELSENKTALHARCEQLNKSTTSEKSLPSICSLLRQMKDLNRKANPSEYEKKHKDLISLVSTSKEIPSNEKLQLYAQVKAYEETQLIVRQRFFHSIFIPVGECVSGSIGYAAGYILGLGLLEDILGWRKQGNAVLQTASNTISQTTAGAVASVTTKVGYGAGWLIGSGADFLLHHSLGLFSGWHASSRRLINHAENHAKKEALERLKL